MFLLISLDSRQVQNHTIPHLKAEKLIDLVFALNLQKNIAVLLRYVILAQTTLYTLESEIVVPGIFIKFSDFSHQYLLISAGMFINLDVIRFCISLKFLNTSYNQDNF